MLESYFKSGNYDGLAQMVETMDDRELLLELGEKLESLGMCDKAAKAYQKAGDVKRGIDCCILHNYWGAAVELAEQNNLV